MLVSPVADVWTQASSGRPRQGRAENGDSRTGMLEPMPAQRPRLAAALFACWIAATSCASTATTEPALPALLADHEAHAGTVIDYDATGTQVLDCMVPNRSFRVMVDPRSGQLEVADPASGNRILVRTPDAVFVHGVLTTPTPEGATWWRLDNPESGLLTSVLGADLAGAALGVPADGNDLVEDAIANGASIVETGDASFALTVAPTDAASEGVRLDVEVDDDGHVGRVTVVSTSDPESSGFRMRFEPLAEPPAIIVPDGQDVRVADIAALTAAPIEECALGEPGTRLP